MEIERCSLAQEDCFRYSAWHRRIRRLFTAMPTAADYDKVRGFKRKPHQAYLSPLILK